MVMLTHFWALPYVKAGSSLSFILIIENWITSSFILSNCHSSYLSGGDSIMTPILARSCSFAFFLTPFICSCVFLSSFSKARVLNAPCRVASPYAMSRALSISRAWWSPFDSHNFSKVMLFLVSLVFVVFFRASTSRARRGFPTLPLVPLRRRIGATGARGG